MHHNKRSSAFLKSIPAASALTPQLQRFLSALSAVTVPLWRPKRGGQRAMQRRSLHSSSTRRRGSRGRPQRHLSVLRPIRGPSRGSRSPSSSHSLRQQPQTLMHLKNVLTALQQVSQLRMSRENSKVGTLHPSSCPPQPPILFLLPVNVVLWVYSLWERSLYHEGKAAAGTGWETSQEA